MEDTLTMKDKTQLSRQKFVSAVSELISGHSYFKPNPEDPNPPDPPWPWKSIINKAFERMLISAQANSWNKVALNPQPLPPKWFFSIALAREVIERSFTMLEIADGLGQNGEQRGIIIVGGYINKFVDDICPDPPKIKIPKMPFPWPPDPEPDPRWTGLELAIIGTQFQNEARLTDHKGIQKILNVAGEKLIEVGIARM